MRAKPIRSSRVSALGGSGDKAAAEALLRRIGEDLDRHKGLVVYRGGTVMPSTGRPSLRALGEEGSNERPRVAAGPERPEARQGQGPTAASPAGPRSGSTTSSLFGELNVGPEVRADIEEATDAQKDGYPQLRVRLGRRRIVWLEGEITPIEALAISARVRISYPRDKGLSPRAWAWWTDTGYWIGPRHANFRDGSICAYEPADGSWKRGDSFVKYIDLVAAWITRHIYLRTFGRWPGWQVLHTAKERLTEQQPGEICGGCTSGKLYEHCHRPHDLQLTSQQVDNEYRQRWQGLLQLPPADESGFEHAALTPMSMPTA